jgi:signal transduction histidine kinase
VGLDVPLWRALTVFRIAALGYAAVLMVGNFRHYAHPAGGWMVVGVMTAWTVVASLAFHEPRRRAWPLLAADLAVAAACLLASRWVVRPDGVALGAPTLPMAWTATPVLSWALTGGRRRGTIAAVIMGVADTVVRAGISQGTINGVVLMLLAAIAVGHIARLGAEAAARLEHAVQLEATTRERERLARSIHDSVLQVLTLVARRGAELGGEAAELGRLAGEQEATLRALVATDRAPGPGQQVDLRALLHRYSGDGVTVAAPASPVWLPGAPAREIAAAAGSAVDNARRHAGPDARIWLLVEDEPDAVTVTVRDNGVGIPEGRLAEAGAAGRLGVAQSIRGRMCDLGGSATVTGGPGRGTEVELRLPRRERDNGETG